MGSQGELSREDGEKWADRISCAVRNSEHITRSTELRTKEAKVLHSLWVSPYLSAGNNILINVMDRKSAEMFRGLLPLYRQNTRRFYLQQNCQEKGREVGTAFQCVNGCYVEGSVYLI